jgi:segregation and condensation protein B
MDLEENMQDEGPKTDPSEIPGPAEPLVESMRVLEAVLFASDELLTTERLKSIVPGQPDARKIRQMVDKINIQLQKERHPFEIVEIGGGYQFRTVSYYYQWVQQLFKEKAAKKLSIQSLECLAIIAYKQPITKAEIEAIRGVLSDGAMKTLLEKRLVTVSGRSEKAGRPLLYATTNEFLTYFGINKLADLPRVEEFEAMAKEKLGELSDAELQFLENDKTPDSEESPDAARADSETRPDLTISNSGEKGATRAESEVAGELS